jgi:hypothetical protein
MKANELRIGNWVKPNLERERQIESIHEDYGVNLLIYTGGYGDCGGVSYDDFESIKPIPLTPEILEKAGFDDVRLDDLRVIEYNRKDTVKISIEHFADMHIFIFCISGMKVTPVDHLHQLQNLYFALTGEELNIKL